VAKAKSYTLIIVPERSSQVRRYTIPVEWLQRGAVGVCAVAALVTFLFVHYVGMIDEAAQSRELKNENVVLKTRLRTVQEEIARIDGTLQRIDQLSSKVRAITQLNDPERNLAIGPTEALVDKQGEVMYAPGERIDNDSEMMDSKLAMRLIDSKLDSVEQESLRQESTMRELHDYFVSEPALLASTPSLRPTKSKLLTSTFGERQDPYTNHQVMHKGIDFAADHGSDVIAPADGVVVFAGNRGGYGKTLVIDHGYGIQSHYAHLSDYKLDIGQKVTRGQIIASVGNTGRSTGAHLHYEVRFLGIPQDPEKFLLE
jgi:murein DD-endopeptidase MepM/ murein hydrolase activator NlpD